MHLGQAGFRQTWRLRGSRTLGELVKHMWCSAFLRMYVNNGHAHKRTTNGPLLWLEIAGRTNLNTKDRPELAPGCSPIKVRQGPRGVQNIAAL